MLLNVLKSKIHRATVVQAELNYVGSITIDEELMEAAEILEYEQVQIVDQAVFLAVGEQRDIVDVVGRVADDGDAGELAALLNRSLPAASVRPSGGSPQTTALL